MFDCAFTECFFSCSDYLQIQNISMYEQVCAIQLARHIYIYQNVIEDTIFTVISCYCDIPVLFIEQLFGLLKVFTLIMYRNL